MQNATQEQSVSLALNSEQRAEQDIRAVLTQGMILNGRDASEEFRVDPLLAQHVANMHVLLGMNAPKAEIEQLREQLRSSLFMQKRLITLDVCDPKAAALHINSLAHEIAYNRLKKYVMSLGT